MSYLKLSYSKESVADDIGPIQFFFGFQSAPKYNYKYNSVRVRSWKCVHTFKISLKTSIKCKPGVNIFVLHY